MDNGAFFKIGYGLYVLTARADGRDNGCIINTVIQATDTPPQILFTVNKRNHTNAMLQQTDGFNLSVLTEAAGFAVFQHFGFQSGRTVDKFAGQTPPRAANGIAYLADAVNAVISGRITQRTDLGTHTLFLAEVTDARVLDAAAPSMTYAYYQKAVKPRPAADAPRKGWRCQVCGYVYEGEELPPDFVCPVCKHGAADFVRIAAEPEPGPARAEPAPAKPAEKKKWRCEVCGYTYEGDELPADYVCPVCGQGADAFAPVDE